MNGHVAGSKGAGIITKNATYLLGAIEFLTDDEEIIKQVKSASAGYRTLAIIRCEEEAKKFSGGSKTWPSGPERSRQRSFLASSSNTEKFSGGSKTWASALRAVSQKDMSDRPPSFDLLGLVRLEDEIRHDAKDIINYFYDNDIAVKIISGDDLGSVHSIAERVGIKDLEGVDLSALKTKNYASLVKNYSIFTRVTPSEKKQLIKALKKQGYTVAMTGDGVNDILAMKEADVSLAIGEGSDAARRASKLVLLNSDFAAVPSIIAEGRQSINNLERSTSLFLAKTVYASILAVVFVFMPLEYPFSPIEMSLLNFACIGFPGLILALEYNTARIKNKFLSNIIEYSAPIGLTVSIAMVALAITAEIMNFTRPELTTASVLITFVLDLILIYWISRPLNLLRGSLFIFIIGIMATVFLIPFLRDFFEFVYLPTSVLIATLIILAISFLLFNLLRRLETYLR